MPLGKGWTQGIRDWARNWFLSLRCAAVGCTVGVIPGLGGSVVDWIAYGHAVQTTKDTSEFGKGDIRGVIAPESANNAMTGGAMLPTILFGIPGSGAMAVFLGCMVLIGIEPGPSMVTTDLHLTYTMIWSLALANIFGAIACVLLSRPIAGLTKVPFQYMAPFLIVMICFAAFQSTRSVNDLIALMVLGVVGVMMKRFGWSRPALLIGYVLAPQAETFLYQAVQFNGWSFLGRTGVIIIGLLTLASVLFGLRNRVDEHGHVVPVQDNAPDVPQFKAHLPQIAFAAAALLAMGIALVDALQHDFLGKIFPLSVACVGLVMIAVLLWELWFGKTGHHSHFDTELTGEHAGRAGAHGIWSGLAWLASLVALSSLAGFVLGVALFFMAFMRLRVRAGWVKSLHLTGWAVGGIILTAWALSLNFPPGLLQSLVDLPWPLR
jgi:hypothetical protein